MDDERSHLLFVSPRGEEHKFEHPGGIPDVLDESGRQLYMDSFILFALPIDLDTVRRLRLRSLTEILIHYTRSRRHWVASDVLGVQVDKLMWFITENTPKDQSIPSFPWELPDMSCSKAPSFVYDSWRKKMGLPCRYPEELDEASTDLKLLNVRRASTIANVKALLEEQHLWQWHNTRATIPTAPDQDDQSGGSD
ncbi:unnamed protein product [Clonostachys solani]|uniref:Uncharacterized protein n=1 Tax=Clonostachys solani TaxID=160281 RepID=A0A9N9ZFR4_9HYPO|nr:unnamed protein product [Clonostachys solani]